LPLLLRAVDAPGPGTSLWLYTFGSTSPDTGHRPAADELLHAADLSESTELSNAAADGPSRCSGKTLRALQLNQRGKGDGAVVGDIGCGDRRTVHLPAFIVVPVDKRPQQMPELWARIQVIRSESIAIDKLKLSDTFEFALQVRAPASFKQHTQNGRG